ncbi:MAG: sulfatase-like hydrolase/transferase [Proteobacteria bacterium]|nr:sulfatase-like hydrolase/transferase [Pseudomonadota bacterium]MCP4922264.1 sulfatase-like hydrolase/transferase [Pseudomonadota bacterium]
MFTLLLSCSSPEPAAPESTPAVHLEDSLGEVTRIERGLASIRTVTLTGRHAIQLELHDNSIIDVAIGGQGTVRFTAGQTTHESTVDDWTQEHLAFTEASELVIEVLEGEIRLGAPTLRAVQPAQPNVLFYVIDGGGADLMSLYGYERPTTPGIEAIAEHGVVFENARTSSAWTKPSTASFMTSLHHSVLGGFTKNEDRIPSSTTTMAEHFHAAGYQTAVFTSNPFAGSMSGLEDGVDVFRDRGAKPNSTSSAQLHDDFWQWRDDWPGEPWWVHVQSTDVHEPHTPIAPYAGMYASIERREQFETWWAEVHKVRIDADTVLGRYIARLEHMGVEPRDFFRAQWDLYDETMTHNDATIDQLVADLKARGEWDNTVLIVGADHGHPAGSFSRFGRGLIEPTPEDWEGALADSYRTHVPLVVIWPGHLPEGIRIDEPVSMIDVLPTVLELADLPPAEVQQGRSLVPLLLGKEWESRPLVIEQVQAYLPTGEMVGHIELVDGDWAASLEVVPETLAAVHATSDSLPTSGGWRAARPHRPETPDLLLYDLSTDPFCTTNVNDKHPELVEKYTTDLLDRYAGHQRLAAHFGGAQAGSAGDAQLEALRVLGYIE